MTPRPLRRLTRAVAGALAITAFAAPTAVARPVGPDPAGTAGPPASTQYTVAEPAPTVVRTIDDGFDWGSAGIGAGAAAIVLLSLGSARVVSHARVRPTR